ncbi:MAG: hypothetical protein H6592_00955 [Flavobacteriales bacterium]|nr:hypothetical protein [Flavobacteriales bacterium]
MKKLACYGECFVLAGVVGLGLHAPLHAQPAPPDFCFVISEPGDADKPLSRAYVVNQQYRERVFYYNSDRYWLKPDTIITLPSRDLFQTDNGGWRVYTPLVGVSGSRILVIAGKDTMRIDLPDDPLPLMERAWRRWDLPSPEVMRFKPGRTWEVSTCINEYQAGVAANQVLLPRLQKEAEWVPPPMEIPPPGLRPPVKPVVPPPPPSPAEIEREIAARPGLKRVRIARVLGDSVWVRITGRVMLNGGCGSGMPLFGIDLLTDSGWVERLPVRQEQMDCGMPWIDWRNQEVLLPPLRWWVGVDSPAATKELLPGTYRIVLMGANMKNLATPAFQLP